MKDRVKWIDVLKGFGIFTIYLLHYGNKGGRGADFVLTHNVPLFFLISGCVENLNRENNFVRYVIKKAKTILIPCLFFALVTVFLEVIQNGYGLGYIKGSLVLIAKGIVRNSFENTTLWFLTCLFSVQILFFLIQKLKYKSIMFLASGGLYYIAIRVLPVNPVYSPSAFLNIDSALFYVLYYAIGYLIYPYVVKLFELDTRKKKAIFVITGGFSLVFTLGLYFGENILANIELPTIVLAISPIGTTCLMIWSYFVVARVFQDSNFFAEIGKNTLYLCGTENIVKKLCIILAPLLGFKIYTLYPLQTHMYVLFLLFVTNRYLVPIEKKFLKKIVK